MIHDGNRIAPFTHVNKSCSIVFANQFQISVTTLCKLERDKKEYEACLNVATLSEDLSTKIFLWWNSEQRESRHLPYSDKEKNCLTQFIIAQVLKIQRKNNSY